MFALSQFSGPDYLGAWNRLRAYNRKFTALASLRGDESAGGEVGEQIFGSEQQQQKKNRPEAKTNSQTFNGVIFPLLHFQQQLYRSNMSLWHKRTPSGSVSLCLNCNRYVSVKSKIQHAPRANPGH